VIHHDSRGLGGVGVPNIAGIGEVKLPNTKTHNFTLLYDPLNLHKTYQKPWFLLPF
jgi:hypothetical protein